jgi:hypothetical protein
MDSDTQKFVVRQFYEKHHENLIEMIWHGRREDFAVPEDFAPPFERVASVTLGTLSPLEVEIDRINQNIPQSVSDAFARHLWYSQWNLAYLFPEVLNDRDGRAIIGHTNPTRNKKSAKDNRFEPADIIALTTHHCL